MSAAGNGWQGLLTAVLSLISTVGGSKWMPAGLQDAYQAVNEATHAGSRTPLSD